MGWRISDILLPAGIKQTKEEVVIIRKAVGLPANDFDLVVDALHLTGRDPVGRMGDDPLEMVAEQFSENVKMRVPGSGADIHDRGDVLSHHHLVCTGVGKRQPLFDEVNGEQQAVLPQQFIILCLIALFPETGFFRKDRPGSSDRFIGPGFGVLRL